MKSNIGYWMSKGATVIALGFPTTLVGCVSLPTTDSFLNFSHSEAPCQIISTWQPDVMQTQDSVNNGMPLLGLGGRLYIFGKEVGKPLKTKGTVVIDLYDLSKTQSPDPVHLEQWTMDSTVLNQLGKNDPLGFGYTLFLPWSTRRPEINQILLKIKFQPKAGGYPLYSETGPMTINQPGSILNNPEYQFKESQKILSPADILAQQAQQGQNNQNANNAGQKSPGLNQNLLNAQNQNGPGQNSNGQNLNSQNSNGQNRQGFNPGQYGPSLNGSQNQLPSPNLGLPAPSTQPNSNQGNNPFQNNLPAPNWNQGGNGPQGFQSDRGESSQFNLTPNRGPQIGIPVGTAPARSGFSPSQNPGSLPLVSAPGGNQNNSNGISANSPSGNSGNNAPVVPRFAIVPSASR